MFKTGNRVSWKQGVFSSYPPETHYGIVTNDNEQQLGGAFRYVDVYRKADNYRLSGAHSLTVSNLVESDKSSSFTMGNLKDRFVIALLSEPQKSFRKAGITNGDNLLTAEGQVIFLTWLLDKNKDAFLKEVVTPLLDEQEKKD